MKCLDLVEIRYISINVSFQRLESVPPIKLAELLLPSKHPWFENKGEFSLFESFLFACKDFNFVESDDLI